MTAVLRKRLLPLAVAALLILPAPAAAASVTAPALDPSVHAQAAGPSCVARENPHEIADYFISRCRRASIRREFPSEYLHYNLRAIEQERTANGRKAWKLLNDSRFAR